MDFRESFHSAVFDAESDFANQIREWCQGLMHTQIPNRPDLWEKLLPNYSPGCKRVIITDDYYPAIADPKTTLETRKIKRVTEKGIEVVDEAGNTTTHEHDLIVLATGFRTVEFLHPIKITGINDQPLGQLWAKGPSALYGTTVPSLPNFGMFYGPNTNLGHNSIILMIEAQSRYLNTLVAAVLDARNRGEKLALMPKESKTNEFNNQIQSLLEKSSFADPNCGSWYKNEEGKITNNWSGTVVEYQKILSKVDWDDYEVAAGPVGKKGASASRVVFGSGKKETRIGRVKEETSVSNLGLAMGALSVAAIAGAWVFRGNLPKRLGLS